MSKLQRHNTIDQSIPRTQLQDVIDKLRERRTAAENAPNDERVMANIGRFIAYDDAVNLVQALLDGGAR